MLGNKFTRFLLIMVVTSFLLLSSTSAPTIAHQVDDSKSAVSGGKSDVNRLVVILSTDQKLYAPDQPIKLTMTVQNMGQLAVTRRYIFPVDTDHLSVIRLEQPFDSTVDTETRLTDFGNMRLQGNLRAGEVSLLNPGEQERWTVYINQVRDMSISGKYRLVMKLNVFQGGPPSHSIVLTSKPINITVGDERYLPQDMQSAPTLRIDQTPP